MRVNIISRILLSLIAVQVLVSTVYAQEQAPALRRTPVDQEPIWTIEHINGGAYRASTNRHGTVFVVTSEGIILADPLSLEFATWLKGEFASRFGVPVKYVVYSHYHWDHASGGEVFADTAQFIGHANLPQYLEPRPDSTKLSDVVGQYEPVAALDVDGSGLVELSEVPADVQRFPGSRQSIFEGFDANKDGALSGAEVVRGPLSYVYPPNITYTDEIEISLGGQRVNMLWVGDMNHSSDTSLITFPDDDVMLIVDYISFRLPNREMDYELGKFDGWMSAIRTTEEEAKKYTYVATGHGPVGTWEGVTVWREYLEELRAEVESGLAAGHSLEDMQQSIKMEKYSELEGFDWVDENVLGMYHFLTD